MPDHRLRPGHPLGAGQRAGVADQPAFDIGAGEGDEGHHHAPAEQQPADRVGGPAAGQERPDGEEGQAEDGQHADVGPAWAALTARAAAISASASPHSPQASRTAARGVTRGRRAAG